MTQRDHLYYYAARTARICIICVSNYCPICVLGVLYINGWLNDSLIDVWCTLRILLFF